MILRRLLRRGAPRDNASDDTQDRRQHEALRIKGRRRNPPGDETGDGSNDDRPYDLHGPILIQLPGEAPQQITGSRGHQYYCDWLLLDHIAEAGDLLFCLA
jgi:hypothetical protein